MSRNVTAFVTAFALSVPLAGLFAQPPLDVAQGQPFGAAQGRPTFRSGVDLVTVDATVLGPDGQPLDHLGPDDFRLEVDGRPRRVMSAQFVSQAAGGAPPARLAATHFTSNQDEDAGRLVVVAVDEAHIRRLEGRPGLRAASSFIDKLDATDRIAVIGLARLGALEFTRDRLALRTRLAALTGQTDPVFQQFNVGLSEALEIAEGGRARLSDAVLRECGRSLTEYASQARAADDGVGSRDACPEQVEQESRAIAQHAHIQARISLSALEALIVSLKDIPGPKTIVVLSEGLVADPRRVDLAKVAAEATAARVTIYALHLEVPVFEAAQDRVSPTLVRDLHVRGDGLARVAGAARGAVFRLVGSDPRPFERIAREISGYYLLAFEPLDTERDGRAHRIQVSLARGGGELRARPGFTLPAVPATAAARDARLVQLLRAPSLSTELPVRVATFAYAEPDSANVRVVVSAEAGFAERSAPRAQLGFVLIDAGGVIAATAAHDAADGRYSFSASVPAGGYTLRVGAIDALGRHGNVQRPFDARVAASRGVRVSDLMLAPPPRAPRDPLEPSIDRISSPTVMAYLELLVGPGELLPDVVRVAVVKEAGGPNLSTVTAGLTRAEPHGTAGVLAVARAELATAALPPGRYVARAEVLSAGTLVTQVARPFSIPD